MEFKTGYAFIDLNEYDDKMSKLKYKQKEIDKALKNFKTISLTNADTDITSFHTTDEVINAKRAEIDKEKAELKEQMKEALLMVKQIMSKKQWKVFTDNIQIKWEPESPGWVDYI